MKTVIRIGLALFTSVAVAEDRPFPAARMAWEACVFSKVDEFTSSERSASDIATAAMGSCHDKETAAHSLYDEAVQNVSPIPVRLKTFEEFRREIYEAATARVFAR